MDAEMLADAVAAKAAALQAELRAKVEANLSGDILQERSGALKASIVTSLSASADTASVALASTGVPYAAIQEEGGVTPPHEIVPVKAKALAFAGAGGTVFAGRVDHPGSVLPARRFLGSALEALHGEIAGGLKDAVLTALGAT